MDVGPTGGISAMPRYRATVHVSGITGENPRAVRSALDAQLRKSGLQNCRIVNVDLEGAPAAASIETQRVADREVARQRASIGGLLLIAALAWAIWFFWWMLSGGD
jgi:ferric-dicitrate binding protein FerR (iron transport regulator)